LIMGEYGNPKAFRLDRKTSVMLDFLRHRWGLSISAAIRQCIAHIYREEELEDRINGAASGQG